MLNDQGLGGRTLTVPLAKTRHDRHVARQAAHRSEGRRDCRRRAFLVEDFVPERLDLKLDPRTFRR